MVRDFLLTLGVFWGIDFLWLTVVAKKFYDKQLSSFERVINWPAIVFVYVLIALGIVVFVLPKAGGEARLALIWGGLFGLVVYGVYDLTNMAVFKNWTLAMTVVDMLWGMTICGMTSLLVVWITSG